MECANNKLILTTGLHTHTRIHTEINTHTDRNGHVSEGMQGEERMNTNIETYMHRHVLLFIHNRTYSRIYCTYSDVRRDSKPFYFLHDCAHKRTCTNICKHTRIGYSGPGVRTHTHTHTHTHINTDTYIYTCIHNRTWIHIYTLPQNHTCMHTYINTYTHTHLYTVHTIGINGCRLSRCT